jgi:hypothetical protein
VNEIEELRNKILRAADNGYLQDSMDEFSLEATLILAEQVKRIADALEAFESGNPLVVDNRGN